jgi:hypothetical protein
MSNSTYFSLPKFQEATADAPILLHRGKVTALHGMRRP